MSDAALYLTLKTEWFNGKKWTNIECQTVSFYFIIYKLSWCINIFIISGHWILAITKGLSNTQWRCLNKEIYTNNIIRNKPKTNFIVCVVNGTLTAFKIDLTLGVS